MKESFSSLVRHALTLAVPYFTAIGIGEADALDVVDGVTIGLAGLVTWAVVKLAPKLM